MNQPIHPAPAPTGPPFDPPRRRGRGLIISGIVLIVVSLVGGFGLGALAVSSIDLAEFERDVIIDGSGDRLVPGEIEFRVPDLSGADSMRVGVAFSSSPTDPPDCSIVDEEGDEIPLDDAVLDAELYDVNNRYPGYQVQSTARLPTGAYTARCDDEADGSSDGLSFTVGRTFGFDDITGVFGGLFAAIGVAIVAGLLFIVGVILLIVGLVQRSKGDRPGPGAYPPGPYGQYPPGPYGQYPQGPYGQSPSPGQHPQPGQYPQPGQPAPPGYGPPNFPQPGAQQPPAGGQPPPAPPSGPVPPAPPPSDGPAGGGWTVPPSKH